MVILMLGAQKKMTDQPCKRDALHKGQHDPCKRVYSNFLGAANNVEKKAGAPVDLAIHNSFEQQTHIIRHLENNGTLLILNTHVYIYIYTHLNHL